MNGRIGTSIAIELQCATFVVVYLPFPSLSHASSIHSPFSLAEKRIYIFLRLFVLLLLLLVLLFFECWLIYSLFFRAYRSSYFSFSQREIAEKRCDRLKRNNIVGRNFINSSDCIFFRVSVILSRGYLLSKSKMRDKYYK